MKKKKILVIGLLLSGLLSPALGITAAGAQTTTETVVNLQSVVKTALENNTDLFIASKQISVSEGALQSASSSFDRQVSNTLSYNKNNTAVFDDDTTVYDDDKTVGKTTSLGMNFSRKNRAGNTHNISISAIQDLDNKTVAPKLHNTGTVNMTVNIPLARGKGSKVTTANEKSAALSIEAAKHDYNSQFTAVVLNASNAYLDYCAIYRKLEIMELAEESAKKTVDEAGKQFERGAIQKNELNALIGSLSDKTNLRIQLENACNEAGEKLNLLMGVYDENAFVLFKPSDDFPRIVDAIDVNNFSSLEVYLNKAFSNRPDYLAAVKRLNSSEFALISAKDSIRHRIDLQVGGGYTGADNGTSKSKLFRSLSGNVTGANASAAVVYEWPSDNNAAKGNLKQQKAACDIAGARVASLKKQIKANIANSLSSLKKSAESFESAKQAVDSYSRSAESEAIKYSNQKCSSIDMITIQDRRTSAQLNLVDAVTAFLKSVISLKYELGFIQNKYFSDRMISRSELTSLDDIK